MNPTHLKIAVLSCLATGLVAALLLGWPDSSTPAKEPPPVRPPRSPVALDHAPQAVPVRPRVEVSTEDRAPERLAAADAHEPPRISPFIEQHYPVRFQYTGGKLEPTTEAAREATRLRTEADTVREEQELLRHFPELAEQVESNRQERLAARQAFEKTGKTARQRALGSARIIER